MVMQVKKTTVAMLPLPRFRTDFLCRVSRGPCAPVGYQSILLCLNEIMQHFGNTPAFNPFVTIYRDLLENSTAGITKHRVS